MKKKTTYRDVIVIGGGPAGSSAALILGRSRLNVLLIDKATPRNIRTRGIHGFLTRHDMSPLELRRISHEEVSQVGVEIMVGEVTSLRCNEDGFIADLADGSTVQASRVVLATGKVDQVPEVEGMERFYGNSVFHCPFCDGWEVRDQRIGAYGTGSTAVAMAAGLLTWSDRVTLYTNGWKPGREAREQAAQAGILLLTQRIIRLKGDSKLGSVEFEDGTEEPCDVMFFDPRAQQQSTLALDIGCRVTRSGAVHTDKKQRTGIAGLYVAGDAAADPNMVVVAAADGVKAALNIIQELQKAGHWWKRTKRAG
jgi:thioredoxin reductase